MAQAILIAVGTLAVVGATASWQGVLLERRAGLEVHAARAVAWGTSLGTLLLAVTISALAVEFRTAAFLTVAGSLGVSAAAAVIRRPRLGASLRRRLMEQPVGALLGFGAAVVATLFIWPALAWFDYHDSFIGITSHAGVSLEMANGTFPPRNLSLPSEPHLYHWGVDVYFGAAQALSEARIDHAIDGVTLALWFITLRVAYLVGRALWSVRVGAAFSVLLAACGGFPWLLEGIHRLWFGGTPSWAEFSSASPSYWLTSFFSYNVSGSGPTSSGQAISYWPGPPFISNFFQSPWALGTPLFLAIVPLADGFFGEPRLPGRLASSLRVGALALLLTALSLAQTATFFLALAAVAILACSLLRSRRRTSMELAAAATCAVVLSMLIPDLASVTLRSALSGLPGLATLAPSVQARHLVHVVSVSDFSVIAGKLGWNLATFGFLFAGLAGLLRRDVRSTGGGRFAIAIAGLGFVIANAFYYERSWDIVKFAVPAQIVLALGVAVTFQEGVEHNRFWNRHRLTRLVVAAGVCTAGVAYQASLLLPHPWQEAGHAAIGSKNGFLGTVTPDELRAIEWLRSRVGDGETVVCPVEVDLACAVFGGLAQLRIDPPGEAQLFPPAALVELERLQRATVFSTDEARAHRVCWVVESPGRTIPYTGIAQLAARSPLMFSAGSVLVFRIC
jgi:hypothetical protein